MKAADAPPRRSPWAHTAREHVIARESQGAFFFFLPRQLLPEKRPVCSRFTNHSRYGPEQIWLTQVSYRGMAEAAQKHYKRHLPVPKYIPF